MVQLLFDTAGCTIDELTDKLFTAKKVTVAVLRLDKIHAIVSGNKLFKLHYFLEDTVTKNKPVLTFGGAYSNHLVATAFACKQLSLKSIGVVRGEEPPQLSSTLQQCKTFGMQLKFISRERYDQKEEAQFLSSLQDEFGDCVIIPEGGYHVDGAKGAALIMDMIADSSYTHIATAVGTATTLAGLLSAAAEEQTIIGVAALKGMTDIHERIHHLTNINNNKNFELLTDYHFGGYAKHTPELISFMNATWTDHAIPLDFVYTAKLFYAVTDQVRKNGFPEGSNILCLHTGGLQGNASLPANTLLY
jgi:1-aminocyclopropane-1-carboxylate deaminase